MSTTTFPGRRGGACPRPQGLAGRTGLSRRRGGARPRPPGLAGRIGRGQAPPLQFVATIGEYQDDRDRLSVPLQNRLRARRWWDGCGLSSAEDTELESPGGAQVPAAGGGAGPDRARSVHAGSAGGRGGLESSEHLHHLRDRIGIKGTPFLVMELLEGETLKHAISGQPMAAELVLQLGGEVAGASGCGTRQGGRASGYQAGQHLRHQRDGHAKSARLRPRQVGALRRG